MCVLNFITLVSVVNMGNNEIHKLLLEAMGNKISKKQKLVTFITDTLCMEKETAYRRIRGEVQFSFKEAILLAGKLNISIDEIIAQATIDNQTRMVMHLNQHHSVPLREPWHIQQDIQYLRQLTQEPYSELAVALSGIASSLYCQYEYISRFYLLKYLYNLGNTEPFEKIVSSLQPQSRNDLYKAYREISNTYYIWDRKITKSIVDDIRYFHSIGLISQNEIEGFKKELHRFFNDLKRLADTGCYPENGNKFELYISDIHIDGTYAYMWTEKMFVSMYTSFILLTTSSEEIKPFKNVSDWIKSLKRSSVQISIANVKERVQFFNQQHEIIDTL